MAPTDKVVLASEIDAAQALWFLELLGKTESTARLRAFPHKHNPEKPRIGARKGGFDLYAAMRWQEQGRGVYVVINDGGDAKESINVCRALFVEWDDQPVAWQLTAWRELGLPEPSIQVATGGSSIHTYWVLDPPISPAQWQPLQLQLIHHCASDENCKDLSRVMRLPGTAYIGADGRPTGRVEIVNAPGHRYSAEQIQAHLPPVTSEEETPAPPRPRRYPQAPRHSREELAAALAHIPPRPPYNPNARSNTYETYRNVLWGLVAACKDLGFDEELAIALMEAHSPSLHCGWNIPQVARSGGHAFTAGTFFHHAKQHGWRPSSND
jgi:hypothetical protein